MPERNKGVYELNDNTPKITFPSAGRVHPEYSSRAVLQAPRLDEVRIQGALAQAGLCAGAYARAGEGIGEGD